MTTVTIRVLAVRSQNARGFGGAIFSGREVDDRGNIARAGMYLVVRAKHTVIGATKVEPGQWWSVTGDVSDRHVEFDGFELTERQIEAESAFLVRPSGEHVVTLMAEGEAFRGIGLVKARRLWETFGDALYGILDRGDHALLSTVLTRECALQAIDAWARHGDSRTLQWLQQMSFDVALGRKVLNFFGSEAEAKLRDDPYRLLSFCAEWKVVDALAMKVFKVAPDDPRRLSAAIEEACYRLFASGHTTALSGTLMSRLQAILGSQTKSFRWRGLIQQAMGVGLTNGSYVIGPHGVQPLGPMIMEMTVARTVAERLSHSGDSRVASDANIACLIDAYEIDEGITLNDEQRRAVVAAATHKFLLITGGAGVGKTTVLKALYRVFDQVELPVTQMALAGRAVKRMQEGTNRPAVTIARFLKGDGEGREETASVIVIDEASMIDIVSMSLLCQRLSPSTRIVLVGDPAQLMPVGPGLVLHALAQVAEVPRVELKTIKRYGGEIARIATGVRNGKWETLPSGQDQPIAFVPCQADEIAAEVFRLYSIDPKNTQILSPRRRGLDGVETINELCQLNMTENARTIETWNDAHGCVERAGIKLGDPVLCTRNLWDHGIQNGSIGIVVEVQARENLEVRDADDSKDEPVLAWIDWDDGERRPLFESMLDDLSLGYAVTVHKAQGSQWPRVIVPLTSSRMLDRTLIYTAITRAQSQVLLVGDPSAAELAVRASPRVEGREVSLDLHLARLLRGTESAAPGVA